MAAALKGGGGSAQFLGKLGLEIRFTKKAPPIGGTSGEVLEFICILRSARRLCPKMGVAWS